MVRVGGGHRDSTHERRGDVSKLDIRKLRAEADNCERIAEENVGSMRETLRARAEELREQAKRLEAQERASGGSGKEGRGGSDGYGLHE